VASPRQLRIVVWAQLAAALTLAATVAWLALIRIPQLRDERDRERAARLELEQRQRADELRGASERLGNIDARSRFETELSALRAADPTAAAVVFDSGRGREPVELRLQPGERRVTLWIEAAPHVHLPAYRLDLSGGGQRWTLDGLERNQYGSFVVSLPADWLPPGSHAVKIVGIDRGDPTLLAEFALKVQQVQ
jgi:hypothetical protein